MVIADVTATGDHNVLSAEASDVSYRKEQLQWLQDEVIDMEDLKTGMSITDLGLNDVGSMKRYSPPMRRLPRPYGGEDNMNGETDEKESSRGEVLVYQTHDGKIGLDVRLQHETLWMSQSDMA